MIKQYLREVRNEMTFVKWPTRKMVIGSTFAVFVISFLVAIYLSGLDMGLQKALAYIINHK
jgi:preprotein translocase SecE subunit